MRVAIASKSLDSSLRSARPANSVALTLVFASLKQCLAEGRTDAEEVSARLQKISWHLPDLRLRMKGLRSCVQERRATRVANRPGPAADGTSIMPFAASRPPSAAAVARRRCQRLPRRPIPEEPGLPLAPARRQLIGDPHGGSARLRRAPRSAPSRGTASLHATPRSCLMAIIRPVGAAVRSLSGSPGDA